MTSDDLIRQLAKREKISLPKAKKLVHSFITSLEAALKSGEKVTFSNFGTFLTHRYPSKTIVDPQGRGHKVLMLPTNVIKWHPSGKIRERLNKGSFLDNLFRRSQKQPVANHSVEPETQKTSSAPAVVNSFTDTSVVKPAVDIPITKIPTNQKQQPDKSIDQQTSNTDTGNQTANDFQLPVSAFAANSDQIGKTAVPIVPKTEKPADATTSAAPDEKVESSEDLSVESSEHNFNLERPRISFEDFVKKSKEGSFSAEDKEGKIPTELNLKNIDSDEFAKHKPLENKNDDQPFIGTVSIEFVDLSKIEIDKKILTLIPEKFARQYQIVPISDDGKALTVGMVDPEDLETIGLIKKQTGREVIPKLAVVADINRILDQYSGVETEVTDAINASEEEKKTIEIDKSADHPDEKLVEDAPVARIVQSLIKRGVREQASDIHIEPSESGLEVRFRIDGILHKKVEIPKDIQASVISRVKILSGIKIDESRLPQDGRIQMQIDSRKVDFRVSTMPTAYGEKVVMRILDKSAGILTLKDLGLRGTGFDIVANGLAKSHGMTLVTGPTGSGKTTTLYAMIDRLLNVTVNIVTLEDPIEYQIPGINQSQVNSEIDYTFANGLRSILRQDPDVVMIGEIRDKETAEMAVNAALTGHIVLSTLHTNDAAGAGPRMIDMGVEPFLITSSLNTVLGQRLTRKICKNCQENAKVSDKELEEVKAEIAKMPEDIRKKCQGKPLTFVKGKGCSECNNTGYKGRLGIFEVLEVNDEIQQLLLQRVTSSKLTEAAIKNGMMTMKQDGIDKALDGLTSLEEVWRVTKD